MRLLFDGMWPPSIAEALRKRGHAVVAAEPADLRGRLDILVFEAACAEEHALITEHASDVRPPAAADERAGRGHTSLTS